MKRVYKSILISLFMVLTMTVTIFANPVKDLRNELAAIGVPSSYVGTIVEYLQKTTISDAQYNAAIGNVDQAKALIGNNKDLSKLSASDKNNLQSLAVNAGSSLGLKVQFGKNAKGVTTVEAMDSKGNAVLKMSTNDAKGLATNFDANVLVGTLETMVEFSNDPNKGQFTPVGGELTDTSTGYGNVMVVGLAMIAGAAGIAYVSKKQFA